MKKLNQKGQQDKVKLAARKSWKKPVAIAVGLNGGGMPSVPENTAGTFSPA